MLNKTICATWYSSRRLRWLASILILAATLSAIPVNRAQATPNCGYVDLLGNVVCVGQNTYTALAFSDSNWGWGASWRATSRAQAEAIALQHCQKYARDCKVQIWAANGCVAWALGENGTWGTGWAEFYDIAEARALGECRRAGGKNCVLRAHPCADDD